MLFELEKKTKSGDDEFDIFSHLLGEGRRLDLAAPLLLVATPVLTMPFKQYNVAAVCSARETEPYVTA